MEDQVVANVKLDCCEVHRREATVDNDCKHYAIPEGEKGLTRSELHSIFATPLLRLLPFILLTTRLRCATSSGGCLTTTASRWRAVLIASPAPLYLALLAILTLEQLLLHVLCAEDEHGLALLLPFLLLSQVFDHRSLQKTLGDLALGRG